MRSSPSVEVRVLRLPEARDLPLPQRASPGSAGFDLRAAVDSEVVLEPGSRARIPTGLVVEIPPGWEGQVRPRSGLAAEHGVTLTNSPGTIDSDFRGEIEVLLVNLGEKRLAVRRGDRIAQMVVAPVASVEIVEITASTSTDRGAGGFGSTGLE
jgi:dUTP pyrophosphatase